MNEKLETIVKQIYQEMENGQIPKVELKSRNKENILFDPKTSVWKYGNNTVKRYASKASSAKFLVQSVEESLG